MAMKASGWDMERGKLDSFMLASLASPKSDGKTDELFQITTCKAGCPIVPSVVKRCRGRDRHGRDIQCAGAW